MGELPNKRRPADRYNPYVLGYAPWDYPGEPPKTSWLKYLREEKEEDGPYHVKMERALEIRDDHKTGKPLPPLPSKTIPAANSSSKPTISEPKPDVIEKPVEDTKRVEETVVVVTVRTPKSLHDRFRDYAHVSRKTKQAILLEALERYLDAAERKTV